MGDWAKHCSTEGQKLSWFHSNVFVQGTNHKPKCMWVSGDGTKPHKGFQVHWPELQASADNGVPEGKDLDYFCRTGPPFEVKNFDEPDKELGIWDPPLQTGADKGGNVKTVNPGRIITDINGDGFKREVRGRMSPR